MLRLLTIFCVAQCLLAVSLDKVSMQAAKATPVYKQIDRFNNFNCSYSCSLNFPGYHCINDMSASPPRGLVPCGEVGPYLANACHCSNEQTVNPPNTPTSAPDNKPAVSLDTRIKATPGTACEGAANCSACTGAAFYCYWFIGNSSGGCVAENHIQEDEKISYTHKCGSFNWDLYEDPLLRAVPTIAPRLRPTDMVSAEEKKTYDYTPKMFAVPETYDDDECCDIGLPIRDGY